MHVTMLMFAALLVVEGRRATPHSGSMCWYLAPGGITLLEPLCGVGVGFLLLLLFVSITRT